MSCFACNRKKEKEIAKKRKNLIDNFGKNLIIDGEDCFKTNTMGYSQIQKKETKIMPLVTTTEMFKKAYNGGYAIGAFNVNNMEIVQGITEAAGELKSPVILQVSRRSSCLCKPYIPCKISRSSSY